MQAVKDKLQDMNAMRKARAEAKAQEKAEKEIAQARVDIAHEVRLAKEAEAQMDLHVTKAGERAEKEIEKHSSTNPNAANPDVNANPNASATAMPSKDSTYTAM